MSTKWTKWTRSAQSLRAVVVTDAEGDAEAVSVVIADELLVVCIALFEIKRAGGGGEGWSDWLSSMRG